MALRVLLKNLDELDVVQLSHLSLESVGELPHQDDRKLFGVVQFRSVHDTHEGRVGTSG